MSESQSLNLNCSILRRWASNSTVVRGLQAPGVRCFRSCNRPQLTRDMSLAAAGGPSKFSSASMFALSVHQSPSMSKMQRHTARAGTPDCRKSRHSFAHLTAARPPSRMPVPSPAANWPPFFAVARRFYPLLPASTHDDPIRLSWGINVQIFTSQIISLSHTHTHQIALPHPTACPLSGVSYRPESTIFGRG